MRMNKILQSGLAIVLAICLLLPGGFFSEAALAEDTTMDGTARVYLSSLGSPSRLDITICGSYSLDGSGATALAALLVVEARHCTVLAHLAGMGDDMAALLENTASPLPVGSAEG